MRWERLDERLGVGRAEAWFYGLGLRLEER